ncbi:MAG: Ig-like domain-containing protein [Rubrobacteraceae bacterium]
MVEKSIAVANVAPVVEISGDGNADEGQTKTYTYTVTDVGVNDTIANVEESCGDNAEYTDTTEDDSFECTFTDGGAGKNSAVSVEATDNDGGVGTDTKTVAVANAKPSIALTGDEAANEGETKTYNFAVTDAGETDTHTITTACGGSNAEKVPGSQTYDPDERTGSFECKFLDGGAGKTSDITATVTDNDEAADTDAQSITVDIANVAPTISAIDDVSIDENTATDELEFTIADDGTDTLTVGKASSDTELVPLDNIVVSGTGANRTVKVTPVADMNGEATITLTVSDGDEASGEFKVTVRPVNAKPTAGAVEPDAVDEDATDNEVEIDLATGAADGETPDAGLTYDIEDPTSGQGTLEPKMDGGNPVPGVFIFDPAPNFNTGAGTLYLEYTVTERGDPDECVENTALDIDTGSNDDGCDAAKTSEPGTITITVNPINDAPVAKDDPNANDTEIRYTVAEDDPLTVADGENDILANDTDVDEDELFVADGDLDTDGVQPESGPVNGTLELDENGSFTYTPDDEDFYGEDEFTYQADDRRGRDNLSAPATVTITVENVEDNPVANNDPGNDGEYEVNEDGTLSVNAGNGLIANDTDADNLTGAANAGLSVADKDDDPDNGIQPENGSQNGTLTINSNGSGSFTYAPNANYNGPDSFTYKAKDAEGNLSDEAATVAMSVSPVADAPVARLDTATTPEDTPFLINVLGNDDNHDGGPLTVTAAASPDHGAAEVITEDGADKNKIRYTPDENFHGADNLTYEVCDSGDRCDQAQAGITVEPLNDAPVANDDSYSTDDDETLTVNAADGLLKNDTDIDNEGNSNAGLTVADGDNDSENDISPVAPPTKGTLALGADGSFVNPRARSRRLLRIHAERRRLRRGHFHVSRGGRRRRHR